MGDGEQQRFMLECKGDLEVGMSMGREFEGDEGIKSVGLGLFVEV